MENTRTMQDSKFFTKAGQPQRAILLKRLMSATVEDLFSVAEHSMKHGNKNVIFCDRVIRTFNGSKAYDA